MPCREQGELEARNQPMLAFQGHRQDAGFPKARYLSLVSAPGKPERDEATIEGR